MKNKRIRQSRPRPPQLMDFELLGLIVTVFNRTAAIGLDQEGFYCHVGDFWLFLPWM